MRNPEGVGSTPHSRPFGPVMVAAVAVLTMIGVACGGDTHTSPLNASSPTDGAIHVAFATSGADVQLGQYSVSIDGGAVRSVGSTDSATFRGLSVGTHTLRVSSRATNCTVDSGTERSVTVAAGQVAVAQFVATCVARLGDLAITAATSGVELAPNGYLVSVDSGTLRAVDVNGSVSFKDLHEGPHTVMLTSVGDNCLVNGNNPSIAIVLFRETATLRIAVACVGSGRIQVTTRATGSDGDPDGYALQLERGTVITTATLPTAGSVTTPPLLAGTYSLSLKGVAENCAFAGSATQQIEVVHGTTSTVALDVACTLVTQLAFVRDGQIYRVNSNGTELVQLTHGETGVSNSDPAWSPDGTRIAFARSAGGTKDIYVMNADGSNVVRRTNSRLNEAPTWSPDGRKIAFSSLQGGQFGIHIMDVDGDSAQLTRVGYDRGWNAYPAWSPDGRTIAFTSDWRAFDFLFDLYVMNADGPSIRPLIQGPFFWNDGLTFYFQPAWSPDGGRIAVVVCAWAWDNCYPDSRLAVANADGSGLTTLAEAGGYARPTWSRDGRTLAFSSATCRTCAGTIRYVRADGSYSDVIVTNGVSPAWRP